MTAGEAIRWVDDKKHNVYSTEDKLKWLDTVERMAGQLRLRCCMEEGYTAPAEDSELSIPAPHDQLYLRWLEAQIDYTNQEYLKYNNAMTTFSALWQDYANALRRGGAAVGMRKFFG